MIFLIRLWSLIELHDTLLLNRNDKLADAESTLDIPRVELGLSLYLSGLYGEFAP